MIVPELTLIKLLLQRTHWSSSALTPDELPKELQGIYRCLDTYHKENDSGTRPDPSLADLSNLYFSTSPRDREYAIRLFDQLERTDVQETTCTSLLVSLRKARLLRELSLVSYDAAEGRDTKGRLEQIQTELANLSSGPDNSQSAVDEEVFVTDDLEVLVNDHIKKPGLRWRLKALNEALGSLRDGDFGFIFARPETGKTTFLASEVTYMAEQVPPEKGPVLWINNEEQGSKVMMRVYQASLGSTMAELFSDIEGAKKQYVKLTGGNIRLHDNATVSKQSVERMCQRLKPSLIVIDQIDKIQGFNNDREDLRLGSIYQWARELAKTYGPVIAVCQADGTGEGQRWLTMAHVANAKTSKQAEADFILGIGKVPDPGFETLRFIHISKNKLIGDEDSKPELRHGRLQVLIDPDKARYKDLT